MTDPQPDQPAPTPDSDLIKSLKDEFAAAIQEIKDAAKSEIEQSTAEIARLEKENSDLKRSLIRDAVINGPEKTPVEKTPEEIYADTIDDLAKRATEYMKG